MRSVCNIVGGITCGNLISTGIIESNATMWVSGIVFLVCYLGYMFLVTKQHIKDLKSLK